MTAIEELGSAAACGRRLRSPAVRVRTTLTAWSLRRGSLVCRIALLIAVTLLCVPNSTGAQGLEIGNITIEALDIFGPEEAGRGWPYALTNTMHLQTRESFIRKLLLFSEGDVYDPRRIAETERNLRALSFLESAEITTSEPVLGVVDITVTTQDSWSTEPSFSFGSKGGSRSHGIDLKEGNVFGTGREIGLLFEKTSERTRSGIEFYDPAFFRPYWKAEGLLANNSDGREQRLSIGRPFYSFDAPRAGSIQLNRVSQHDRIFRSGVVSDTFAEDHQRILAEYGLALHRSESRVGRLTLGLDLVDHEFSAIESDTEAVIPSDRHHRFLFARYERLDDRFVKLNWINRDIRYEDINLGTQLSAQIGISPRAFGAGEDETFARLGFSRGFPYGPDGFLLATLNWDSRFGGERANSMLVTDIRAVHRFRTARLQTFVGRIHLAAGHELDGERQLFADAESGLRGYHLYAFEGDKLLVLNAEHRIFLGREVLQMFSPGIAMFVDAGTAAPTGTPLSFSDLKVDAGVGLRLGLSRTGNNSLRIDFAWAFDPDPLGREGMLVSVSMSQAF